MELDQITFQGPPPDDTEILDRLPIDLRNLLLQINGFIQFQGGLHVRGACKTPAWHSIREAWTGESAFYKTYPAISNLDIPFAQDCMGDQFLLRAESVIRLKTETGDLEQLDLSLSAFLENAGQNPIQMLGLQPLILYQNDGNRLSPGQLLSVYPPFCTKESASGISLKGVSANERLAFLADFYRQIGKIPDGQSFQVKVVGKQNN